MTTGASIRCCYQAWFSVHDFDADADRTGAIHLVTRPDHFIYGLPVR
jgi:hypothetical protein